MEAPYKCYFLFNTSDHIKLINLRQQDREKMLEIFRRFLSHRVSFRDLRITAYLLTFCIEKDSHIDAINEKIASNYAFLRLNKENKILLGHPPPRHKNAQGYERSRYGCTDNC